MALKNLFDMVKADRYTADGHEALIKAQESETEDKVYQIGEISQKTGLQKTANGWVKPKKGAAPAKKQEKKGAGIPQATTETFVGKTYKDFVESATPSGYKPTKNTDNPDGSSTTVFEKEGKQIKVDFDKNGKITKVSPGEEAGKTSRANKEEAIRKDLGLTAGEDMSRFSDEQIEKMYAKTQQTPEQQKADFDKSKIGQAVNKGRQEFAAEKARQKELASKTNAIGLPKESKPAVEKFDDNQNKKTS